MFSGIIIEIAVQHCDIIICFQICAYNLIVIGCDVIQANPSTREDFKPSVRVFIKGTVHYNDIFVPRRIVNVSPITAVARVHIIQEDAAFMVVNINCCIGIMVNDQMFQSDGTRVVKRKDGGGIISRNAGASKDIYSCVRVCTVSCKVAQENIC